jgi:hypothetical protein
MLLSETEEFSKMDKAQKNEYCNWCWKRTYRNCNFCLIHLERVADKHFSKEQPNE